MLTAREIIEIFDQVQSRASTDVERQSIARLMIVSQGVV